VNESRLRNLADRVTRQITKVFIFTTSSNYLAYLSPTPPGIRNKILKRLYNTFIREMNILTRKKDQQNSFYRTLNHEFSHPKVKAAKTIKYTQTTPLAEDLVSSI